MPWQNGTFTRSNGTFTGATVWATDETVGFGVVDRRQDTHDQGQATGVDNLVTLDGQNPPTQNINWGGFELNDLGAPVAGGDIMTLGAGDSYLATDGSSTVTADIPMNEKKITDTSQGTNPGDILTIGALLNAGFTLDGYGWCNGQGLLTGFASKTSNCSMVSLGNQPGSWQVTWDTAGGGVYPYNNIVLIGQEFMAQLIATPVIYTYRWAMYPSNSGGASTTKTTIAQTYYGSGSFKNGAVPFSFARMRVFSP